MTMTDFEAEFASDILVTKTTRRPAWADRTARREFQAGLRGDVGL